MGNILKYENILSKNTPVRKSIQIFFDIKGEILI